MPSKDSKTRLTARQRLGWLAILLLMFASLTALIWRSKPAPRPPQVLQWPIAPVVADSAVRPHGADSAGKHKARHRKRKKRERKKAAPAVPKPADAPRDITAEDVASPTPR